MNNEIKNPFANPDGSPVEGKEFEFFDWAREQELKRRALLSKEEQSRLRSADKHLAAKMNS
jgi:hypothetical protein